MFKKLIAAVAVAGCLALFVPQAANAEMIVKPGHRTTSLTQAPQTATATSQTVDRISSRLASDGVYADQLATAVASGNTKAVSQLFASEGAVVQSVDQVAQTDLVIQVRVTVCVSYGGYRVCGTIIVTVEL
jgi:hypothetical protein